MEFNISNGSGGYAEPFHGFINAHNRAIEDTEEKTDILAITVNVNGVDVPIAFAVHGQLYSVDAIDCPVCDGGGLEIVGFDNNPDVYENIGDECACCHGTGVVSRHELLAWLDTKEN